MKFRITEKGCRDLKDEIIKIGTVMTFEDAVPASFIGKGVVIDDEEPEIELSSTKQATDTNPATALNPTTGPAPKVIK